MNHLDIIIPNKVKWKYFALDKNGNVVCATQKPEGKNVTALLNTSL